MLVWLVSWLVGCGLTSHSAIFQLYSDGTVVQFGPAAGHPTPWAARGLKRAEPTPTRAPGCPKTSFTSLPSEGQHAVRVSRESNPDRPIQSLARCLCATAAGNACFENVLCNTVEIIDNK